MAYFGAALSVTLVLAGPAAAEGPRLSRRALERVLDAARSHADGGTVAEHETLSRRSRLSGLVPRLRLGLRRGTQYDLYRNLSFDAGNSRSAEDQELSLTASAVFELDRLVFASDQVRILRSKRAAQADVQERVREVIALVFDLEKRWMERRTAADRDPALDLEIAELQVLLDALTGGVFSEVWREHVRQVPPAPPPPPAPR